MKRKTALLIILSLLLVIPSGCGDKTEIVSEKIDRPVTSADEDEEKEDKSKVGKASVEETSSVSDNEDSGRFRLVRTYFDQSKYTENGGYVYFQSFGNHILCSLETETAYPKLAKALRDLSEKEEKDFKSEIKEFDRDAFEYEESIRATGGVGYYYHYADDLLKRADEKCVSIVRVLNGYLGGAHPDFYYDTYNFDPSTGERIVLSDVIADKEKLNGILEQKLLEDYPEVEFFGLKDSLAEYDMTALKNTEEETEENTVAYDFSLDPDGISFYFSPYGISAYAYGDQVVKILYDEEPSLFIKDFSYKGPCISYLTDMDNKYGTGSTAEKIRVERDDYDENDYFQSINVVKGKQELKIDDLYYFSQTSFMADNVNDRKFVYILGNMDNDYKELFAVDMNGKSPEKVEFDSDISYTYSDYYDEASGIYGVVLPLYPDDMELGIRCALLSTYVAKGHFEVLDNGGLKLKDRYLTIPEDIFVITSKQDLKADIVDEDGMVKDRDVSIPKGSEFTLFRTDGVRIVDAKLDDGRIVRLNVEENKVNGTADAENLFDGMMFAG